MTRADKELEDDTESDKATHNDRYLGMSGTQMEIEYERRRAHALDLRVRGLTTRQIGEALDITEDGAGKLIRRELARLREANYERAEELRSIAHARFETLIRRLWLKAMPAEANAPLDYEAIRQLCNVIDRDARIMGYAAPQRHQIDMNHLQAQIGMVIEVVARIIPDDDVPKVYAALEEAFALVTSRERSLENVDIAG